MRWESSLLVFAILGVAGGLSVGVISTTRREPGRPNVRVERVDADSIRVIVDGEGLESDSSFETRIDGYDAPGDHLVLLASARLSPNQSGELHWSQRIRVPPSWITRRTILKGKKRGQRSRARVARVLINVDKDLGTGVPRQCDIPAPTCVFIMVPLMPEATRVP
jgi:hypothetical protein